ncbi:MAG: hypothetical protein V7731_21980 [Amphritea sp.]
MVKKYKSDLLASIHETMKALHDAGLIDPQTMREFNNACLYNQDEAADAPPEARLTEGNASIIKGDLVDGPTDSHLKAQAAIRNILAAKKHPVSDETLAELKNAGRK